MFNETITVMAGEILNDCAKNQLVKRCAHHIQMSPVRGSLFRKTCYRIVTR